MSDIWFPALRYRIRFRNRFRKNRVRTCRFVNIVAVAGACSATGPVGRPASFPCESVGRAPGVLATEMEK